MTDIVREDRNIEVRMRTDEGYRDSVRDLRNLNIRQSGATPLPLSAVAEVTRDGRAGRDSPQRRRSGSR